MYKPRDISALLGDAHLYTLHSHTEFCDGRAQMEAFAREAVAQGFTRYGFSPHSPIPITSTCNMHHDKVSRYLAEVERMRLNHPECNFFCSMEIDYLGRETGWGPAHPYFDTLPLDYRISSVHFIPNRSGEWIDIDGNAERFARNLADKFNGDLRYVVDTYFDQTEAMLRAGRFDIIGHFDKIGLNASSVQPGIEQTPLFGEHIDRIIDLIADTGVTVEINTKAYGRHGRFFPSVDLWQKIIERGIAVVINSDAHVPALINAGREEAFELLKGMEHKKKPNH